MLSKVGQELLRQKSKRTVHISGHVLVVLSEGVAVTVLRKGDIPKAIMKHESRITRPWQISEE